ncbi:MAG: hypothetical protein JWQ34_2491 [Mucilaginibacter sp.]|uniref:hypothetical protein n=1 Tax=Mucilaginibacter sp. TaxID=1882438 RepID=UPI0026206FC2|nr:hypothetical protein [Mucilaginibacter sp.]MDB5004266.1 hypothetical protein [Mucilaginibacter sp.]
MKKAKNNSIAKKAKKALKKDLGDKIAAQIKITVGQFLPGVKKAEKSIEKAAKNLAKKLAKLTSVKVKNIVIKKTITPPPVSVAKTPAVAVETAPIKATPAKPVAKPAAAKAPAKPAIKK